MRDSEPCDRATVVATAQATADTEEERLICARRVRAREGAITRVIVPYRASQKVQQERVPGAPLVPVGDVREERGPCPQIRKVSDTPRDGWSGHFVTPYSVAMKNRSKRSPSAEM